MPFVVSSLQSGNAQKAHEVSVFVNKVKWSMATCSDRHILLDGSYTVSNFECNGEAITP